MQVNDVQLVTLNVGGTCFSTTTMTLANAPTDSLFATLSDDPLLDELGNIFIDRSPTYFHHILNYLRDGNLDNGLSKQEMSGIMREAKFYNMKDLEKLLEDKQTSSFWSIARLLLVFRIAGAAWTSRIWQNLFRVFAHAKTHNWHNFSRMFATTQKMMEKVNISRLTKALRR